MSQGKEVPQHVWGEVNAIQRTLASARKADNAGEEALAVIIEDIAADKLPASDVQRRYKSLHRNRRRKDKRHAFLARREAGYYAASGRTARKPSLDHPQRRLRRQQLLGDSAVDRVIHDLDNKLLVERVYRLVSGQEWSLLISLAQDATVNEVADRHSTTAAAVKTRVSRIHSRLRDTDLGRSVSEVMKE